MKNLIKVIIICVFATAGVVGCDEGPDSPRGFSLPEGSQEQGLVVFNKYQCLSCHSLEKMERPEGTDLNIALGGTTTAVKTYAQLVTSIINPTHKLAKGYHADITSIDGKSKMTVFNDVMTVQELVDVVTFLQPKYKVMPYTTTNYPNYPHIRHTK